MLDLPKDADLFKYDSNLGLVLGWAIICTENGQPYVDLQKDHCPEDTMLEAATDFMLKSRGSKVMHEGEMVGTVVYAFPVTDEIKKAFKIECPYTGLAVAIKPEGKVLQRAQAGDFTGFSIGGAVLPS